MMATSHKIYILTEPWTLIGRVRPSACEAQRKKISHLLHLSHETEAPATHVADTPPEVSEAIYDIF